MHPVFYYLMPYMLIGIVGMALGNRKVPPQEQQQRWVKLVSYLCIIVGVKICILAEGYWFVAFAILLILTILVEVVKVALQNPLPFAAYGQIGLLYLLLVTGFLSFAFRLPSAVILTGYFVVVTFDGFSQISGQLFGKTPFFTHISPAKTREGFIGGACFGLTAALLAKTWLDYAWWQALATGLASVVLALTGDLAASYYKRLHHVKDFGKVLPGQGGITDRFDSFLWVGAGYGYFGWLFM
ncbi:phosphatidate cytidylyltransferase [Microscilla marina]|uniref:Phosphatidate cytidylyltransferase n=1 Tax=Microscilla marina ATCC 23134 TaxID=313606 RepID=A1ZG64_MICM2|nr:phosphatidate cytidylyltransferase [Microscilla marina]EAY30481.1 phosphatidate cytidylyltransferase [Microscilla marina ATCC 23134]